jgi:homoserine acetyltransferase
MTFPAITTRDQAAALWALLDAFGVAHLSLVVGGSLGGMVALEVAALRPACVGDVVVLAAPAAQTALGAGWHAIMRTAVRVGARDRGWRSRAWPACSAIARPPDSKRASGPHPPPMVSRRSRAG